MWWDRLKVRPDLGAGSDLQGPIVNLSDDQLIGYDLSVRVCRVY
jgi:hypothetical protein